MTLSHLSAATLAVLLLAAGVLAPAPADASSEIRRACLQAGRAAASHNLCGCIQDVAETMFSRTERKNIVKFFKDPHLTQQLRQSDRRSDERFWEKYKEFGTRAQQICG